MEQKKTLKVEKYELGCLPWVKSLFCTIDNLCSHMNSQRCIHCNVLLKLTVKPERPSNPHITIEKQKLCCQQFQNCQNSLLINQSKLATASSSMVEEKIAITAGMLDRKYEYGCISQKYLFFFFLTNHTRHLTETSWSWSLGRHIATVVLDTCSLFACWFQPA